jgi:hypothetical protein
MIYHREKETQWQANGDEVEVDRWKERDTTNGKQMEVRLVIYTTDEGNYVTKIEVEKLVDGECNSGYCYSVDHLIANGCVINRHGRVVDISTGTDPDEPSTIVQDAIRFVFASEDNARMWSVNCIAVADFNKIAECSAMQLKMDQQRIGELRAEIDELERQLNEELINGIHGENEQHLVTDSDSSNNGINEENSDSDSFYSCEDKHSGGTCDSNGGDNEQI